MLSDPQILTSGCTRYASSPPIAMSNTQYRAISASRIFAGGNLSASFDFFTKDHACNKFCEFYGLEVLEHVSASYHPSAAPLEFRDTPALQPLPLFNPSFEEDSDLPADPRPPAEQAAVEANKLP
jgi:hypothetical protein